MLGTFLKRFNFTRKIGVAVQWIAFLLYLWSLSETIGIVDSIRGTKDGKFIALFVGFFTLVPLLACSVQFYRAVRRSKPLPQTRGPEK
jgi:hypothetical protein